LCGAITLEELLSHREFSNLQVRWSAASSLGKLGEMAKDTWEILGETTQLVAWDYCFRIMMDNDFG